MCVLFLVSYLLLRTLVRSSFVLAPLLGFTYVIGLFANGYVLGYVYIILNDFLVSKYSSYVVNNSLVNSKEITVQCRFWEYVVQVSEKSHKIDCGTANSFSLIFQSLFSFLLLLFFFFGSIFCSLPLNYFFNRCF